MSDCFLFSPADNTPTPLRPATGLTLSRLHREQDRFEAKAFPEPNSGCWIWTATTDKSGYGRFRVNGISVLAHRKAYEIYTGPISAGLLVCHRCDTPACVNPDHLFLGTFLDNSNDMMRKNRGVWRRGENHKQSKLTTDQVLAIRSDPRPTRRIAAEYGVTSSFISQLKRLVRRADA